MSEWAKLILTLLGSGVVAYITSRVSRRKEPEDKEAIITATAEKVQGMFKNCIDQLSRATERLYLAEREIVRLGGNPENLGGFDGH